MSAGMSHVLFSRHGRVGLITLNRPEKLNAFADRMRDELVEIVAAAAADDGLGAVVITGAGRAFCAGADVNYLSELVEREDWDALDALVDTGARVVTTIDHLEKPVLAAVNGVAAGGGANLALACDLRIAASRASIGQTFNRIGLQPDWGGTYFLPRLVGLGRALELVFTADMVPADEALRVGLFNRVVSDDTVVDETLALAERIAAKPPLAVALAKRAVRRASTGTLADALACEQEHQRRLFRTAEAREGIRAFLDKRDVATRKDSAE
jgi:2-(1,2-epoxy-1,2-dihydrophenyl)acetyl-CoA isomerase